MERLESIIQSIEETTTLFYQNKMQIGYQKLEELISSIDLAMVELSEMDIKILEEGKLTSILTEAMNAMEHQDALLLADILEYELKEVFQRLL